MWVTFTAKFFPKARAGTGRRAAKAGEAIRDKRITGKGIFFRGDKDNVLVRDSKSCKLLSIENALSPQASVPKYEYQ